MIRASVVLLVGSFREFTRSNSPTVAAGIAFWTLLSLFPLTLGTMALLGHLFHDVEGQARVVNALVDEVPIASDYLRTTVSDVARTRGPIGAVAALGLVWSGMAVFATVRTGINHAWGVRSPAPFLKRRFQDLAMFAGLVLLAFVLLLGANLVAGLLEVPALGRGLGPFRDSAWWKGLREAAAFTATCGALLVLYRYLPNARVRWPDVWPGVLVGALFFEATKLAFSGLLGWANDFNLVYGSLGALVSVLAWVYFSAFGLLLGAQVAGRYSRHRSLGVPLAAAGAARKQGPGLGTKGRLRAVGEWLRALGGGPGG